MKKVFIFINLLLIFLVLIRNPNEDIPKTLLTRLQFFGSVKKTEKAVDFTIWFLIAVYIAFGIYFSNYKKF
uniref:secG_like, preprotein translocase SecG subunit n=1 Tax=Fibrocapsa japonica TaxID=94617 RepID=UPI0021142ACF|nr:secG_like, preprotein translocase SecG subunit [Fibrocapsa japonica]UTE95188.1 secG_like, preprotein translocase SecG subunit [Fibrocapsa japonica]